MAKPTTPTPRAGQQAAIVFVCPTCRATLPDRYVDLPRRRAVCAACGEAFPIDRQLAAPIRPPRRPRRPVALPAGLAHEPGDGGLTIRWRWPRARATPAIFFAALWSGFLAFLAWLASANELVGLRPLLIVHAAIAGLLIYLALIYRLNSTLVELRAGRLRVRHGPIPWLGNRDLPAAEVRQLFSQMYQERGRRGRRQLPTYRLKALLSDGRELLLVHNMPAPEQALYLEQALEGALGIADEPARGELPR